MKKILVIALALLLSACGGSAVETMQATPRAGMYGAVNSVTPETGRVLSTPTVDELGTAYAVIAIDQATSTAQSAATSTAQIVTSTYEAKATEQFWVGVTLQVATQRATETQVASTERAGTQQSAYQTSVPPTQTALAATQQIEQNDLQAEIASIWIWRVGSALFVVGLAIVFVVLLYRGIPIAAEFGREMGNAKVMREKTDALKPDANGRRPAVPSSVLKDGETLIIPELAHRASVDPNHDDLTPAQALQNAHNARELEGVRAVSQSPIMSKYLVRDMQKQGVTPYSVRITKPEPTATPSEGSFLPEREVMQALPAPTLPLLFSKWDGELLPFGADEDGKLMRVDPSVRAHFMVVGRSRSGKTLSSIRPMVACLLTMGWNVVVMGKRVDFMPFEEHHNFKLIAVDVRKDARRYIDTLNVLTAQMDVRDKLLASKGVSTWDRYGAAPTMIVIDDYSGAMLRMPRKEASEVLNEVKSIAFDGAKFGLHLTLGLQRATWENIDTNLRSQMGRIVYSLESAGDSRIALGEDGAERLPLQFNFLTRMTDDAAVRRGVGFMLQDMEIDAFLRSRPVEENEPLAWIDAEAQPVEEMEPATVTQETPAADLQAAYKVAGDDFRITELYLKKCGDRKPFSLRSIEQEIFKSTGGAAHDAVKAAIARLENVGVDEVASVLKEKFAEWKQEDATTTHGATSPENGVFLTDSTPVAG